MGDYDILPAKCSASRMCGEAGAPGHIKYAVLFGVPPYKDLGLYGARGTLHWATPKYVQLIHYEQIIHYV